MSPVEQALYITWVLERQHIASPKRLLMHLLEFSQQNFMVLVFWLIQLIQDGYLQIWVAEEEEVDVQ